MDRAVFYEKVRDFLRETNGNGDEIAVNEDDNLFDLGIVTSFTALSMILFIEELLGRIIDLAALDVDTFHTLRRLYDRLVAESPAALNS